VPTQSVWRHPVRSLTYALDPLTIHIPLLFTAGVSLKHVQTQICEAILTSRRTLRSMKRSDAAMARRVDDDVVILDITSGQFFGINDVGALVWDLLEHDTTRDVLVEAVTAEFDVDSKQAGDDIDALIAQLSNAGLVEQ
jgi:hypothetical protein